MCHLNNGSEKISYPRSVLNGLLVIIDAQMINFKGGRVKTPLPAYRMCRDHITLTLHLGLKMTPFTSGSKIA